MIFVTAAAQRQVEALERHYSDLGREVAIVRMTEAVAMAAARIEARTGPFWAAPRPYPDLIDLGYRWPKQGRYWVAFTPVADGYAVTGVFFDTADIPRHTSIRASSAR